MTEYKVIDRGWDSVLCNHVGMWDIDMPPGGRTCCNCGRVEMKIQGPAELQAEKGYSDLSVSKREK